MDTETLKRRLAAGLLCLLPVAGAHAGSDAANLDEARRLLDSGQVGLSAALLEGELMNLAGQPDFDYLLGLALLRSGRAGEARFAFERVLMAAPERIDARLQVASLSADGGDPALTGELLAPLAGVTLNAEQQARFAAIHARLAQRDGAGFALRGYLSAGLGYNSNVTGGPNQQRLLIPGLSPPNQPPTPTDLGSATRAGDQFGMVEAGLALAQSLSRSTTLRGNLVYNLSPTQTRDDVADGYLNLDIGLNHREGGNNYGVTLVGQDYRVGYQSYRRAYGGRLNWARTLGDASQLGIYAQYLALDYAQPQDVINNARRSLAGLVGDTQGKTVSWQLGAYGGEERAKDASKPHFSYWLWGSHLGLGIRLGERWRLALGALYEARNHLSTDPLYLKMRRDSQRTFGINLDYALSPNWHLIPQYTASKNLSNAELYSYSRQTWMLHLRWDFDHAKQ